MDYFSIKNGKKLRRGFTTGSCAAGAAAAATQMLLTGTAPVEVVVNTPAGVQLHLPIEQAYLQGHTATCAICKDAGDDPDVTHGIAIYAQVAFGGQGITLVGGDGVGVVTQSGLSVPVGEPAINPVPRKQIMQAVEHMQEIHQNTRGLIITIFIPNGEEIAKRTFNSRLGILGGLSILGTSGLVEPMSEQALIDTIRLEIDRYTQAGARTLLFCPGNYGKDFVQQTLGVDLQHAVTISNFIGEALDYACYKNVPNVLLIGHAGKLVKLAAGIMQTHSSYADGRQEIFAAHAALAGAPCAIVDKLMQSITVDACIALLQAQQLEQRVFSSISKKIEEHITKRTRHAIQVEYILFTNQYGELFRSEGADVLLEEFRGVI